MAESYVAVVDHSVSVAALRPDLTAFGKGVVVSGGGVVGATKSLVGYVVIVAYLWKEVEEPEWAMGA